jgi:hypothetical protein
LFSIQIFYTFIQKESFDIYILKDHETHCLGFQSQSWSCHSGWVFLPSCPHDSPCPYQSPNILEKNNNLQNMCLISQTKLSKYCSKSKFKVHPIPKRSQRDKFHAYRMLIRYIVKSMENSKSRHFESKMQGKRLSRISRLYLA